MATKNKALKALHAFTFYKFLVFPPLFVLHILQWFWYGTADCTAYPFSPRFFGNKSVEKQMENSKK